VAKPNAKGRRDDSKHVRLYRYMWPALLERLDGNAFKALFYMLTFEDGSNNANIYMGARTLGEGIQVDKKTALRCLQHLDCQGFIRPDQLGYFTQKGGPATRWRFTFLPANGKPPTNEWRQAPAEQKSWGENFPEMGGENPPAPSIRRTTGGKSGPVDAEIDQPAVGKNGTQSIASGEGLSARAERADLDPQIVDGPIAGDEAVQAIRAKLIAHWRKLGTAAKRRSWAAAHGVSVDALRTYLITDPGVLPFPKQAALASAVRAEERAARAARRSA
jgi:hypothetical protein